MSESVFLVTGAHGFIGSWVVKRLLGRGHRVVLFDRNPMPDRLRQIMDEEEISRASFVAGDITEASAIPNAVERFGVDRIIHLAALQIPSCRANPRLGAMVNVVGTINVFEAAVKSRGQVKRVAYASSAAVFGRSTGERAASESDAGDPDSLYGAFKRCSEENARVYFNEQGVRSIGLRPHTVYGVGRDFGMTSDPTKAMKAAVVGRPFHIRFGGSIDFQYAADAADAFIEAALAEHLDGARVFNLHGETSAVADIVREIGAPGITFDDKPLSAPHRMDDSAIRQALGELPSTSMKDGVRLTMERFAELARRGNLDTKDLEV